VSAYMTILNRFTSLVAALTLVFLSCTGMRAQNDGTAATQGPIVVLITIDGFPARALKDPRLPMPTLRKLEADGVHADAMQPVNPTVTWPNHTALITGVDAGTHHILANGLITFPANGDGPKIEPWVPKEQLVHARSTTPWLKKT
jgi:predicted AlkP superfamily pyrophosphatase or phosphodiesterase